MATNQSSNTKFLDSKLSQSKTMTDEEKFYKRDGILYSTIMSPPENLDALKNFEAREDDVFLVAYPKCGFNWMVAVLKKIMTASTGVKFAERISLIEFLSPETQQTLAQEPSPRLLGTHLHPDNIPASFNAKATKILVVFRNPKDTAVSYYHFMNNNPVLPSAESWDKFISDFLAGDVGWGSYFDHALAWEKRMDDPKVLIVTFEELKENAPEGITKVAEFFGFPLTDEQVSAIASETTFSAMLSNSKKTHSNIGHVIFRKGEVGDWKNHFTEAQSKQMDEEVQKKLGGTKLAAKMKYEYYCQ